MPAGPPPRITTSKSPKTGTSRAGSATTGRITTCFISPPKAKVSSAISAVVNRLGPQYYYVNRVPYILSNGFLNNGHELRRFIRQGPMRAMNAPVARKAQPALFRRSIAAKHCNGKLNNGHEALGRL